MSAAPRRVVIVGGGVTGVTAAYALQEIARAGLPLHVTLIEGEERLGGKILSERAAGFLVEGGPDALLSRKPWGVALCKRLGLAGALVPTDPAHRGAYVRHRGRLVPIPPGFGQLMPPALDPIWQSPLLSPWGRVRIALEPRVPAAPDAAPGGPTGKAGGPGSVAHAAEESLAGFVRRRFGPEVLARLAEPLLCGIYAGDPEKLSLAAAYPELGRAEALYGSLIAAGRERQAAAQAVGVTDSVFVSLPKGLGHLVHALDEATPDVEKLTGVRAIGVEAAGQGRYAVRLGDGRAREAGMVLIATPAASAADLLGTLQPRAARGLREIPYVSVAIVVLGYDDPGFRWPRPGTGYVVPRTEKVPVTACTWASAKWPHVSTPNRPLFRVHFGRDGNEAPAHWPDERLVAAAQAELAGILGLTSAPALVRVYRWPRAMPQYVAGHLARLEQIEAALRETPGLFLAGAAYRGVGIPDCIRQAEEAAERVAAYARGGVCRERVARSGC